MFAKYGRSKYDKSNFFYPKRYDRRENAVCALYARREREVKVP